MKRIISAIVGIFFIGIVIYFGIRSGDDSRYIVPFGIISALIAPMGLSALGYSIKREDDTLQKLAKVSQIDKLIEQAETEAEKIERLKREKGVLLNYIKNETKRIAKIERKKILEEDAKRVLNEYKQVIDEINSMPDSEVNLENASEEIRELYNIQNELLNKEQGTDHSSELIILGISYSVQSLLDFYRLPAEVLVDQINNSVKIVFEGIQELEKKIKNIFN